MKITKDIRRQRRHYKIRSRVSGSAERPRLCVNRTLKNLSVQLIDDQARRTLAAATTNSKEFRGDATGKSMRNVASAKKLGALIAQRALEHGIRQAVFDRNGYLYHGCVKAIADAAREAGLTI